MGMRVVYIVITVFLLLCVFFTRWYLCDVRGLCTFPVAIMEILLMLLAAFFVGFAASWLLRETSHGMLVSQSMALKKKTEDLQEELQGLEMENQSARKHLADWQQEAGILSQQKKLSDNRADDLRIKTAALEDEIQQHQRHYENLKSENDELRETMELLKKKMQEEKPATVAAPSEVMEEIAQGTDEDGIEIHELFRSRFTPSTWQTQDDLALISGIGPVIHRKLNELGIYSFEQISELTPGMVRRITSAIKFFPGRIGRDNWIGQAAALMKQK